MMGLQHHWLWLIAAAALGIAEIIVPGVFMIWIGGAALVTGLITLLFPIPLAIQLLIFAVAAFTAVYLGRNYLARNPITSSDPLLNDRVARLIGEVVTAVEPVDATHGRVRVGDSIWSARGADAAVGDRLRIVSASGSVLVVERI